LPKQFPVIHPIECLTEVGKTNKNMATSASVVLYSVLKTECAQ